MATLYCPECGYKNEYSIHPPNFCGGCGERISAGGEKTEKPKSKRKAVKAKKEPSSEDETDIDFVPEITGGLQVDISYEMEGRGVIKGEDLAPRENPNPSR
jgi:hypothetical protein